MTGPPLDWSDAEKDRFIDAIHDRRRPIPAGWLLRPGGHWAAKGGLTTIVAHDPRETPDEAGRRPSDQCVGMTGEPGVAVGLCATYNGLDGLAARLRPVFEALDAALPAGPCPSDPCPLCTAMEGLQSLLLDLEGRT